MIELFENRIAPAALTGKVLTYTDLHGDAVKITFTTHGTISTSDFTFNNAFGSTGDQQLELIDLNGSTANEGASIIVTVGKAGLGNVNIGYIDATGIDLGAVSIPGDLGGIKAGDGTKSPGLGALTVDSMGVEGASTLPPTGYSVDSRIHGAVTSISIAGNFEADDFNVTPISSKGDVITHLTIGGDLVGNGSTLGEFFAEGAVGTVVVKGHISGGVIDFDAIGSVVVGSPKRSGAVEASMPAISAGAGGEGYIDGDGLIGSITIYGDIQGGSSAGDGQIFGDSIGKLTVYGSIIGGGGQYGGSISSETTIGSVTVKGSIFGGGGPNTGGISSGGNGPTGGVGAIKISGDVVGGTGQDTGFIYCEGKIASLAIGGSLIGGYGNVSGDITSTAAVGAVTIGHDILGASITSGSLNESAAISADSIASVVIGGSVYAGLNDGSASLTENASIEATHSIGSITVKGNVVGSVGTGGVTAVVFTAGGALKPTAKSDLAIGKLTVGGAVEYAQILAGYNQDLAPIDGNAQIGPVSVVGDWIASDLIAGAQEASGAKGFGGAGDSIIGALSTSIAKITSVTIGGIVSGTAASGDDFAFESAAIGSFKVNGYTIPVPAAPGSVALDPTTADVTLRTI